MESESPVQYQATWSPTAGSSGRSDSVSFSVSAPMGQPRRPTLLLNTWSVGALLCVYQPPLGADMGGYPPMMRRSARMA